MEYSGPVIKWPIPEYTQLELVALLAVRKFDPTLTGSEPIHSASIPVEGLGAKREVDALFLVLGSARVTVEAQKRGRKVTQPIFDGFEGKMAQVKADRTIIVSRAGFVADVIRRVEKSNGRFRALVIAEERLKGGCTDAAASVEVCLENGNSDTAALRSVSVVDCLTGLLGHVRYGICPTLRLMIVMTVSGEAEMDDGTASIVVLGRDSIEVSVTYRVVADGTLIAQSSAILVRTFQIPTGRIVD